MGTGASLRPSGARAARAGRLGTAEARPDRGEAAGAVVETLGPGVEAAARDCGEAFRGSAGVEADVLPEATRSLPVFAAARPGMRCVFRWDGPAAAPGASADCLSLRRGEFALPPGACCFFGVAASRGGASVRGGGAAWLDPAATGRGGFTRRRGASAATAPFSPALPAPPPRRNGSFPRTPKVRPPSCSPLRIPHVGSTFHGGVG